MRVKKASTGFMIEHLRKQHSILPRGVKAEVEEEAEVEEISDDVPIDPLEEERKEINQKLVQFMLSTQSSLAIVESKEFQALVSSLNPDYQIPSRQTLREIILSQHGL